MISSKPTVIRGMGGKVVLCIILSITFLSIIGIVQVNIFAEEFLVSSLNLPDMFGNEIFEIGDQDGDGINDYILGIPINGQKNFEPDSTYVLFMNSDGTLKTKQRLALTQIDVQKIFPNYFASRLAAVNWPTVIDPNFIVEEFVTGIKNPTQMTFVGNDILVLEKNTGDVRLVRNKVLQPAPVLHLPIGNTQSQGLLGITNIGNTVYIYFTEADVDFGTPIGHRVYKYTWDGTALTNPILIKDLPAQTVPPWFHTGGPLAVGLDDTVYGVIGDLNARRGITQNIDIPGGAPDDSSIILPVNRDESILKPKDTADPFTHYTGYGVRSSFGLKIDPFTGNLWVTENGPDVFDEINLVTNDYNSGWNPIQGPGTQPEIDALPGFGGFVYSDPEFSWEDPVCVTAISFVDTPAFVNYHDTAFVGDCNEGNLYNFNLNPTRTGFVFEPGSDLQDLVHDIGDDASEILWGTGFGRITDIDVGPDGLLYIASIGDNVIYRISSSQRFCDDLTITDLEALVGMPGGFDTLIDNRGGADAILVGTSGPDLILAGDNGDTIDGMSGDDCIIGGDDEDTIDGGDDDDQIFGGEDDDNINGGTGNDFIDGGEDEDILRGSMGDDILIGGQGDDNLFGGEENDSLTGGPGDDSLDGGPGTDTCVSDIEDTSLPLSCEANQAPILQSISDQAVVEGETLIVPLSAIDFDPADTLTLSVTFLPPFGTLTDNGDGTGSIEFRPLVGDNGPYVANQVIVTDDGSPPLSDSKIFNLIVSEHIEGRFCDNMTIDELIDSGSYNVIDNRGGSSQILFGTSGDDLMLAGDNNDDLRGRDGNDCIIGGAGNDMLRGVVGNDQLFGRGGDDLLTGHHGNDYLDGGLGTDEMRCGGGIDTAIVSDSSDIFTKNCEEIS